MSIRAVRRLTVALIGWVLASIAGCSPYSDLPLLELDRLYPSTLQPGDLLRVSGQHLPVGARVVLELEGVLHRPGGTRHSVSRRFDGEVHSSTRIECPVARSWVASLGRGTFEGAATVRIPSFDRPSDVVGQTSVRFNVVPDEARHLAFETSDPDSVSSVFQDYGLQLAEVRGDGLKVVSVVPGAPAYRSGLRKGDTIRELNRMILLGKEDFLPKVDGASSLVVRRPNLSGLHRLRLSPPRRSGSPPLPWWLLLALGVFVGLCSPAQLALRGRRPTMPSKSPPTSVHAGQILTFVPLACLLLWLVGEFGLVTWCCLLGVVLAVSGFRTPTKSLLLDYVCLVCAVGVIVAVAGQRGIAGVVGAQHALPWQWWVCMHPATFFALGALVASIRRVTTHSREGCARLYVAATCVLGGCLFLGGWAGAPGVDVLSVGTVLLVVGKASLFYAVAWMVQLDEAAVGRAAALSIVLAVGAVTYEPAALAKAWPYLLSGLCVGLFARWIAVSVLPAPEPRTIWAPSA